VLSRRGAGRWETIKTVVLPFVYPRRSVGDELYDVKIRVLGEMMKHHIEEEEQELFAEVASAKAGLGAVGKQLAERKEELMARVHA
jgi:hypothetical protein